MNNNPPRILAIILNWNEIEMTKRCLDAFYKSTVALDLLVVDNHSDNDPCDQLYASYPHIKVIRNPQNLGVAGGRNVGLRYALENGYEYVMIFDNDAYAAPNMIEELLNAARRYHDTGMFGPKIYRDDQLNIIWRAGCTSWRWSYLYSGSEIMNRLAKATGLYPWVPFDTLRGLDQPDIGQFESGCDIDFQIGCAQLIRVEAIKGIGLLDEAYSPYGSEDIDYCARLTRAGWKIRYVPTARAWHRIESSYRENYSRAYQNAKNILLLARKQLSRGEFYTIFLADYLFCTIPLKIMRLALLRNYDACRGVVDAIKWHVKDVGKKTRINSFLR